ncbi:MAG: carboxypeptidase-like regulatory domain-containing protein [Chitinophagales bacterium]
MISTKNFFLSLLIITFIVSCQTGIDETTINEIVPSPQVLVKTNLRGVITDEQNQPLEGAEVKAGSDILFTDQWGYFSFDEVKLGSEGALVTIKKDGYFNGSRYFKPNLKDNFIQVKLIEQRVAGSFSAANGGVIDLNDGAQIIFPANIFQKVNGDNFDGTVLINAYWLNPTLPDVGELMPTNLIGENLAKERVVLASLGMMVAELTSNTGEILQIKEDSQVELLFPIPAELQATAPAVLPLWSFTEEQEIWLQEGQAALEGNYYKAKVSHFSWWNCDWPYPAVDLTGKIVAEGQGLADVKIRITLTDRPWSSTEVFTNVDGDFTTEIPASTLLHLEVLNACNEVVYSSEIEPYVSALDYGEIPIDNAAQQFVDIQGQIVDCQQAPVNNGYAIIYYDDRYRIVELLPNGQLMASIILCDTTSEIRVMALYGYIATKL